MENQSIALKIFSKKRGFALVFTIFLVIITALLSYRIVENNIFFSNLNKLKYLHFQANIFMDKLKVYIETHTTSQILAYTLTDPRFDLEIIKKEENGTIVYYAVIQTIDDSPIRLSEKIIK
jgi:hypothetical protein